MSDQPSKSQQKRIASQRGLPDPFSKVVAIDSSVKWQGKVGDVTDDGTNTWVNIGKAPERRYHIEGDGSGHKFWVENGMEGEFQAYLDSFEQGTAYEGYNYEKNRIDGRFTFTDPRNE